MGLVERARALRLPREPQIVFVAVHDGARRARAERSQVHEVQPVVGVESNVGHEKVKGPVADPRARGLEPAVTLDVRERRRGRLEDAARRLVGLHQEDVRR